MKKHPAPRLLCSTIKKACVKSITLWEQILKQTKLLHRCTVVDKLKQDKISPSNFRKTEKETRPSDLPRSKDHQEQDDSKTAKGQQTIINKVFPTTQQYPNLTNSTHVYKYNIMCKAKLTAVSQKSGIDLIISFRLS